MARQRGVRPHRLLRRRDLALVRVALRGLSRSLRDAAREVHGASLRREPAPEGGAVYRARRRSAPRARRGREAARQAALVQQHPRPRLGPAVARRVRAACVRDRQAQQPLRDRDRARSISDAYERAFACDPISAFGGVLVFNRPIDEALAERLQSAVHRGPARARVRGRGDGDPDPEGIGPDPRGRRPRPTRRASAT